MGRVLAQYTDIVGTSDYELDRTFVYGNGINDVLVMFLPEDELDENANDDFLSFVDAWLADPNSADWNASWDSNADSIIDFADFCYYASDFDTPDIVETDYYYLKDALGSVVGLIGGKFGRTEEREFYNYDIYGQPSETSTAGNPYMFAGMRYDAELGTYHTLHRTYSPQQGRWFQHDPIGYADSMNLYEYVASNPMTYIDPKGLNLYAIGGTAESHADGYNTERVYRYYEGDGGPRVGKGRYFYDGVGTKKYKPHWFKPIDIFRKLRTWDENLSNMATGKEATEITNRVKKRICKDYCRDKNMQINIVGWSRGAASALEVADQLNEDGCCCDGTTVKPEVNWLGLFDAVEMTTNSMMAEDIASNVKRADHARRTQKVGAWAKQLIFPRVSGETNSSDTVLTTKDFYWKDGRKTSHNDIGTKRPFLRWMMQRGEKAGLTFDWKHYARDNK
ncbi:Cell wall-associated polypeptide CWBP200 [Anaerohalosphaera lusitana]|uniref:Cell wall-associated polypeptide CWBP200 n=1 Tax=Anaerohalosphaera lusitana TaxID=1936003 RepID=A0A1U9NK10_9BACT|nr:RHS repeat-associated core domain-containing protein [Anaerohalosphaera lusitana]AQT68262.1 Cell wall-associated polypeptide CWBP200 [Anaerohalosphaera lusitana]